MNPTCLYDSHLTPSCPYQVSELPPLTPAERRARDRLRQLKADGRISSPLPGETPYWQWALPWLLPILLPLAMFLFFVFVLLFG
ncbi:hypothetical protein [Nocardia sp. IFM 10818]